MGNPKPLGERHVLSAAVVSCMPLRAAPLRARRGMLSDATLRCPGAAALKQRSLSLRMAIVGRRVPQAQLSGATWKISCFWLSLRLHSARHAGTRNRRVGVGFWLFPESTWKQADGQASRRTAAKNKRSWQGEDRRHGIGALNQPSWPWLGCISPDCNSFTRWRPPMTEILSAPAGRFIGPGAGRERPDGSQSAGRRLSAQRSQPDTFREASLLAAQVRRGATPAAALQPAADWLLDLCLTEGPPRRPLLFGAAQARVCVD